MSEPIDPQDSLIEYPCVFPIKVMGLDEAGFVDVIHMLAREHDPAHDPATTEQRPSSGGKYIGLTLHVTATSREQLDNLYRALTSHPTVKYVL